MNAFYIEGKVCNKSKCAIQVNKVGLKPTYTLIAPLKLKVDVRPT